MEYCAADNKCTINDTRTKLMMEPNTIILMELGWDWILQSAIDENILEIRNFDL